MAEIKHYLTVDAPAGRVFATVATAEAVAG